MPDNETGAASRFAACLEVVLAQEGGFVDNPKDPGGATNMGITRATLAAWRKVMPPTALSIDAVKALSRDEASAIYRAQYWNACRGDDLVAGVDLAVFDFAVNSGPQRAVGALQAALKVTADGLIGPVTLAALRARVAAGRSGALIGAICDARLNSLQRLAAFATFGRGWSNRVAAVRSAALKMAGITAAQAASAAKSTNRSKEMDFLSGYKTYIVAGIMVLLGLVEMAGISLPTLDGQSGGHLLMEAFAVIFLRRGIQTDSGKA